MNRTEMAMAIEVSRHMGLVIWRPASVGTPMGPKMAGDIEAQLMLGHVPIASPLVGTVRKAFR